MLRSEHGRIDDKGRAARHPRRSARAGHPAPRPGVPQRRPAAARRRPGHPRRARPRRGRRVRRASTVAARPRVEVLVLGDELLTEGLPQRRPDPGRARPDAAALAAGAGRRGHRRAPARRRREGAAQGRHRLRPPTWSSPPAAPPPAPWTTSTPRCAASAPSCWWTASQVRPGHPMLLARTQGGPAPRRPARQPPRRRLRPAHARRPLLRTLAGRPAPEPYTLPLPTPCTGIRTTPGWCPWSLRGESRRCRCTSTARRCCAASRPPTAWPSYRRAGPGRAGASTLPRTRCPGASARREADGGVSRETSGPRRDRPPSGRTSSPTAPGAAPATGRRPARSGRSAKRLLLALLVLVVTALIVCLDRDGYHDNADGAVDLLDAFYYATVTLSTTGYGDITPASDGARLTNILARHAAARAVPDHPGRHHSRGAHRTHPGGVPAEPLEVRLARPHRRRRLRHQGPLGGPDAVRPRG